MNDEIQNIIRQSSFIIEEGCFVYVKVAEVPVAGSYFMVTHDADEITVVTREENLGTLKVIERNKDRYCLIALHVSIPFYSVGFLAAVSEAIACEGMNILIVSTYSKDYILVRYDYMEKAKAVLLKLGFKEIR